ncbi:hypothetical protein K431DRAFT_280077 [Polychaeton citri CBS 116435]|uniref:Uncharacterized protein n=1 Tax=Polychaeton citri CBS 116435 TaxID=1314669 RepID=A0A9P4QGI5_9PEZI|nr:hypothetical protein K431DRAFT_280077 [Polychaeton citri CBS 116435]
MSFHYQPQVDSSDEDIGIDLSIWKSGARPDTSSISTAAPTRGFQAINSTNNKATEEPTSNDASLTPMLDSTVRARSPSTAVNVTNNYYSESDDYIEVVTSQKSPSSEPGRDRRSNLRKGRTLLFVKIAPFEGNRDEYEILGANDHVRRVLSELTGDEDAILYKVEFEDRHVEEVPFEQLLLLQNGQEALASFDEQLVQGNQSIRSASAMVRQDLDAEFVDPTSILIGGSDTSEDELALVTLPVRGHRKRKKSIEDFSQSFLEDSQSDTEGQPDARRNVRSSTTSVGRTLRSRVRSTPQLDEDAQVMLESDDSLPFLQSDIGPRKRRRKVRLRRREAGTDNVKDGIGYEHPKRSRISMRATRHTGAMREVEVDDIFRSGSDSTKTKAETAKPKVTVVREVFKTLPRNNEFRMKHMQICDSCGENNSFAQLVYCQGCTLSYHKRCLGHRTSREHLVTKVGEDDFVMQCRRCISSPRKKEKTAPDHGKCQDCRETGSSCIPFRPRKPPAQEQREREENEGIDPIVDVNPGNINNSEHVMFRCVKCSRAFHFEHLPPRDDAMLGMTGGDVEQRFREYGRDWTCRECLTTPAKVSTIIAWKPIDEDKYDPAYSVDMVDEDDKAYLVKWDGMSYFRASWMAGAWVWGTTAALTRKAFCKKAESWHPRMRTEDAIPEEYLRTDIVLDIKYTSIVDIKTEEIDKARIREIDKALIKYKGLGYEDAVWEQPPTPEDGDRWTDFVLAYNDWVLGRYVKQPSRSALKVRVEKARAKDFAALEKKVQPENVVGGELMKYQIEGMNWLYYKWHSQKNAILADEMGLGKTIQVIGFLASLIQDWSCFPFLVVVPNSTCPNWRREIKRWAPSLRSVVYYGSKEARDLVMRHELFPENSREMKAHVVITSYEAAADDTCRKFFRNVPWQGLIVDEGQRLKNEKTQMYSTLGALKTPFKVLLTGTPLQNNQRELFNLLQFLDDTYNTEDLAKQFEDLTAEKITDLHNLIRPFFLRRTKAQVLTFLPPMAQIIVPVSMSIVQRKLYRTILAKNPDLLKAIFSPEAGTLRPFERSNLNNILMQLRKCLCHPFVYNKSIEDKQVEYSASHRNLVDASSKLKLLEILLPKLRERGHRVLVFSQFLDMLDIMEDFLDGLALPYQRLDGSISTLNKQKRIDEFNAPDSALFAFLLSTRAGGVGINLATADTVIILDPDFNPHQDIQALSRAHRIGQHKKVLCFQLLTRSSAEEKIMQIGRKKLALDHVLIRGMDDEDSSEQDLTNILRHGASELFNDDNHDQDIVYDSTSVDRLLDRSHVEDTQAGEDKSAETQFSFARVWANDAGALTNQLTVEEEVNAGGNSTVTVAPDPGVWAKILRERERLAAEEASAKSEAFGRGRRARAKEVDYAGSIEDVERIEGMPGKSQKKKRRTIGDEAESDTDFQANDSEAESEDGKNDKDDFVKEISELESGTKLDDIGPGEKRSAKSKYPHFKRASFPPPPTHDAHSILPTVRTIKCRACKAFHVVGSCPLKLAGVEYCNLCGMAHFGYGRVCPHIQSETQVRLMLEALKHSNESEHHIAEAKKYLRGLKGNLVQEKKNKEMRARVTSEATARMAGGITEGYSNFGGLPSGEPSYREQQQQAPQLKMGHWARW